MKESTTYNLYEAKTALSQLVDRAFAGHEIVIAKAGKPMAKLVPIQQAEKQEPKKKRNWGNNLLGVTYVAPDFDDPVWTDEELKQWDLA